MSEERLTDDVDSSYFAAERKKIMLQKILHLLSSTLRMCVEKKVERLNL